MNNRVRQFRYEQRRSESGSTFAQLTVHVLGPKDHSISTLAQLAAELYASIPFNHKVIAQPYVTINPEAGSLIGVAGVEMVIEHGLDPRYAAALLKNESGYLERE